MEKKTADVKIVITKVSGKREEILRAELKNVKTSASVRVYCGVFVFILESENRKKSEMPEPKDEVEIWMGEKGGEMNKVMAGYIDKIVFEKSEKSAETAEVYGRSYDSILVDSRITGRIKYSNGLSQVIREVLKNTQLKPDDIRNTSGNGIVIFRNTPLIDAIRQIAEELNWTFSVDYDKVFHFHPYVEPKNVGTIDLKDVKSYKIEK